MNIAEKVTELATPVAEGFGLTLWDVEYKKEGSDFVLRIYIDKPEGISIDDCEKMHRAIDPVLDEADPIPQSYMLEVSSAGLVRELKKDAHYSAFLGKEVTVFTFRSFGDLPKRFKAVLVSFDEAELTLDINGEACKIQRSLVSKISIDLV